MTAIVSSNKLVSAAVLLIAVLLGAAAVLVPGGPRTVIFPQGASGAGSCPVSFTDGGSTTVYPIPINAESAFEAAWPNTDVVIDDVGGSGVGITNIRNGSKDMGNTSRPLKLSEVNDTIGNSLYWYEVAKDGLVFAVRKTGTAMDPIVSRGLTYDEIKGIYEGTITDWFTIDPAMGHHTIVPRARITSSGSQPDMLRLTGTNSSLEASTIAGTGLSRLDESSDMADAAAATDYQIVYTSLANYPSNPGIDAVPIADPAGTHNNPGNPNVVPLPGIVPSKTTVSNGSYEYLRVLYMLTRNVDSNNRIDDSKKVRADDFINYILSGPGQAGVGATGFVEVSTPSLPPVPDWDINMDGATSIGDLGAITAKWGQSMTSPSCPGWIRADANNSNSVSLGDIGTVTNKWGNAGFIEPVPYPGPYSP